MINSYLCYITNEGERPGRKNTLERVTRKLELKLAAGTSRRNRKSKGAKGHGYRKIGDNNTILIKKKRRQLLRGNTKKVTANN